MWHKKQIDLDKSSIKGELEALDFEKRHSYLKEKVEELNQKAHLSCYQLQLYLYMVFTLSEHLKAPFLEQKILESYLARAREILAVNRIVENKSRLSYLHGELAIIESQLARNAGDHWLAAFQQAMAPMLSREQPENMRIFQNFAMANRALRLGQTALASESYRTLASQLETSLHRHTCVINYLQALRLQGDFRPPIEKMKELGIKATSQTLALEIEWESVLIECLKKQDFRDLLALTRKSKPHYKVSYICEANLYILAGRQKAHLKFMLPVKRLQKRKDLSVSRSDRFYKLVLALQNLYDLDIPIANRLGTIPEIRKEMAMLITIDKELLAWAALNRFLIRTRHEELANLTRHEYRSLCLKVTGGSNPDVWSLFN